MPLKQHAWSHSAASCVWEIICKLAGPAVSVALKGTTDVSQQSEIQTYYTLQTFLGIHVEPEMVDTARDFAFFARHCMQNC